MDNDPQFRKVSFEGKDVSQAVGRLTFRHNPSCTANITPYSLHGLGCGGRVYWIPPLAIGGNSLSLEDVAKRNFNSGFNCAESVLLAVTGELATGQTKERVIPRIATGFGGGIGRNGDVCGALTGGTMAISLVFGRNKPEESRDPCYSVVDQFYSDFRAKFGSCKCRELTNLNMKTPEGAEAYNAQIHAEVCNPIVAWAARRTHDLIKETS